MNKSKLDDNFEWSTLVGFDADLDRAIHLFESNKLPQIILFEGRDGIGKSLFLRKLLAHIYCDLGNGCGLCPSCQDIKRNEHPELLFLDPDGKFKIEDGQSVQDHLSMNGRSTIRNGLKISIPRIAVLVDIDRSTDQAANQMLKTLEEPNEGVFVFMSTSKPKQILDTILSRTVKWYLRPPPADLGLPWLIEKWKDQFSPKDVENFYRKSGYAIGKVQKQLENHNGDEQKEIDSLLRTLIFGKNTIQAMDAAMTLTKQCQMNPNDLSINIELLLNQYYKWQLGILESEERDFFDTMKPEIDRKTLRRWRQNLGKFRSLAGRSQIPLNGQMVAETFALTR